MKRTIKFVSSLFLYLILVVSTVFSAEHHTSWNGDQNTPYEEINNNIPYFTEANYNTISFESYSELDELGRVGVCFANIGTDLMPKKGEKRGDISTVYPTGWKTGKKSNNHKYNIVNGGWVYNRSHMIGWQLTAENANKKNLFTGTRYINVNGMLPFENDVADYLRTHTDNHVLYRVTPIFEKDNLVCEGVRMEGWSVEDKGEGVCFNVFCYNVQPDIEINYKTGENWKKTEEFEVIVNKDYTPIVQEQYTEEGSIYKERETSPTTTQDITAEGDNYITGNTDAVEIKGKGKELIDLFKLVFPIFISTVILIIVVTSSDKIINKLFSKK